MSFFGIRASLAFMLLIGLAGGWSSAQEAASDPEGSSSLIAPDARLIVDQYLEATGGRSGWSQVKTVQGNGTVIMPVANVIGTLRVAISDDVCRRTMKLRGGPIQDALIETGRNGEVVWQLTGEAGQFTGSLIEGEERARQIRQWQFSQLIDLDRNFERVEMVDVQEIDGKQVLKVLMVPRMAPATREYRYFDQASHLIVRTDVEQPGRAVQTSMFRNYRRFGPVKLHTEADIMSGSQILMKIATPQMTVNQPLPEDLNEMPLEIRVLLGEPVAPPSPSTVKPTTPAEPAEPATPADTP